MKRLKKDQIIHYLKIIIKLKIRSVSSLPHPLISAMGIAQMGTAAGEWGEKSQHAISVNLLSADTANPKYKAQCSYVVFTFF